MMSIRTPLVDKQTEVYDSYYSLEFLEIWKEILDHSNDSNNRSWIV